MKKKIIILKILLLLLLKSIKTKILFVFEHFRHGARNPCNHIDKNGRDYLGKKWDFVGELTNVGKRQHFLLGLHNQEKYKNFLLNYYHPKEILVYSTNRNRTIESATANLMGMFFKKGKKIKENQKKFSIPQNININNFANKVVNDLNDDSLPFDIAGVPIHLFKEEEHDFMLHEPKFCHPIAAMKYKLQNSNDMKKHALDFKNEFGEKLNKFLEKNGNEENYKNMNFFDSFINVYNFCDHFISDFTFDSEDEQIKKLEKFQIDLDRFYNRCQNLMKIMQFDVVFGREDVLLMSMSPPFRKIINWMEKRIHLNQLNRSNELDYNSPKFVVFSGHDTTVAGFQKLMNKLFDSEIINPEFAASVYFELVFFENNNSYFVNYINGDVVLSTIEFNEFKRKVEKILWSEKEVYKFCDFDFFNVYKIFAIVLIVVIVVLVLILVYCVKKNKNNIKLINDDLKEIKPIKLNEEKNDIKKE